MNRADKIRHKMAQLQMELEQLAPYETMTARELARKSGVSPATAARFKRQDFHDMQIRTIEKLMPFVRTCPTCGAAVDPEAGGDASTDPSADEVAS
jgi:DNA-binding MurR/RpiR family transcriptional regulator